MYIVPIVHTEINTNTKYNLINCGLFLDKNGTSCISLGNCSNPIETANEFLSINGFFPKSPPTLLDTIVLVEIDPVKTDLNSFYKWSEVLPTTQPVKEVWRYFVWNNHTPDTWGTNMYLDSIDISPYSVGHILKGYFKTKCV